MECNSPVASAYGAEFPPVHLASLIPFAQVACFPELCHIQFPDQLVILSVKVTLLSINYTGFILEVKARDFVPTMNYVSELGMKLYMKLFVAMLLAPHL
jgi:hypothetical protein